MSSVRLKKKKMLPLILTARRQIRVADLVRGVTGVGRDGGVALVMVSGRDIGAPCQLQERD